MFLTLFVDLRINIKKYIAISKTNFTRKKFYRTTELYTAECYSKGTKYLRNKRLRN